MVPWYLQAIGAVLIASENILIVFLANTFFRRKSGTARFVASAAGCVALDICAAVPTERYPLMRAVCCAALWVLFLLLNYRAAFVSCLGCALLGASVTALADAAAPMGAAALAGPALVLSDPFLRCALFLLSKAICLAAFVFIRVIVRKRFPYPEISPSSWSRVLLVPPAVTILSGVLSGVFGNTPGSALCLFGCEILLLLVDLASLQTLAGRERQREAKRLLDLQLLQQRDVSLRQEQTRALVARYE